MSVRTAEPKRASGWTIVAGAAVLVLLAFLGAFLVLRRTEPIDGRAALLEAFGASELPAGFEVVNAKKLPSGARLVVLRAAGAVPEPALADAAPAVEKDAPKFDWTKVPLGSEGAPPSEIAFLLVDPMDAKRSLDAAFGREGLQDTLSLGNEGGRVLGEAGKTDWKGFDARWVLVREFSPGPSFRDVVRLDASVESVAVLATAAWKRGERGSLAALETALAPLERR